MNKNLISPGKWGYARKDTTTLWTQMDRPMRGGQYILLNHPNSNKVESKLIWEEGGNHSLKASREKYAKLTISTQLQYW